MDHASGVARQHRLHHLPEEGARQVLLERTPLRDVVEEVLAVGGAFEHVDEGVRALEEVEQLDHARYTLDGVEELQLHWDALAPHHRPLCHLVLGDMFDRHAEPVRPPHAGVDFAKPAFAEHVADTVLRLEGARRAANGVWQGHILLPALIGAGVAGGGGWRLDLVDQRLRRGTHVSGTRHNYISR